MQNVSSVSYVTQPKNRLSNYPSEKRKKTRQTVTPYKAIKLGRTFPLVVINEYLATEARMIKKTLAKSPSQKPLL